jgi:hypothetical protein
MAGIANIPPPLGLDAQIPAIPNPYLLLDVPILSLNHWQPDTLGAQDNHTVAGTLHMII